MGFIDNIKITENERECFLCGKDFLIFLKIFLFGVWFIIELNVLINSDV